jgi:uncharacterized membrane protein YcaP (DUF421 family)
MDWIANGLGLGLEPKDLTWLHVSLRGIVVFIAALIMVRLGDRRFLAKMNPLDVILGFILASMLARAVNGSSAFLPTIVGGFVLVLLHKAFAALAFHSHTFGKVVKGEEKLIIENGEICEATMRAHHISEKDLLEELRQEGNVSSPKRVQRAWIERSGRISVVPFEEKKSDQ